MNGAEAVIADPHDNIVTNGTVMRFATNCPLITGYTSKQGFSPETNAVEGYFLVDTESGISTLGMTDAEWSDRLTAAHWQRPSMHATHTLIPKN